MKPLQLWHKLNGACLTKATLQNGFVLCSSCGTQLGIAYQNPETGRQKFFLFPRYRHRLGELPQNLQALYFQY